MGRAFWLAFAGAVMASVCSGGAFSWREAADRPHPHLFRSAEDFRRAAAAADEDPALAAALADLLDQAEKALSEPLSSFDASWWEPIKDKPWEETYGEVFRNTWTLPGRAARNALTLARAWMLTGRKSYADAAARHLLSLADYPVVARHYDIGMNYSVWLVQLLGAYDILFDRLAEADRDRLDALVGRLHSAIRENDEYWIANGIGGGINNHLCWHKAASACVGAFYGKPELIELAVEGRRGFAEMVCGAFVDDGLWPESSLYYHFAAVDPLLLTALVCARFDGRDLFNEDFSGRRLRDAYTAILGIAFPDGTLPGVGDTYGRRPSVWNHSTFEIAYRLSKDPTIAWALRRGKASFEALFRGGSLVEGVPPPGGSRRWPQHGYVRLSSDEGDAYWSGRGLVAFVCCDRSGVHHRADAMGLILFGRGRVLLDECEARTTSGHSFSSDIQGGLNRTALAANALVVDCSDPSPLAEPLEPVRLDLGGEVRMATVADLSGKLWEGVVLQRTVAVWPDFVVDVYRFLSAEPHIYEYLAHGPGPDADFGWTADGGPVPQPMHPAASWLREVRGGRFVPGCRFEWKAGDLLLRMTPLVSGDELWRAGFPESDDPDSACTPMVALRVRSFGGGGMFAVVYQAGDGHMPPVRLLSRVPLRFMVGKEVYELPLPSLPPTP